MEYEHYVGEYLNETIGVAATLDKGAVNCLVHELVDLRARNGRLWIAGLGGSAANASHAANDFRKLCGIEAICLTDNVAELTARANDEGWAEALSLAFASSDDTLLVLSVGGGTEAVSLPLVRRIDQALAKGLRVLGICGRIEGHLAQRGHCVVVVPCPAPERLTPHTEGWQSVILHCLVSHPLLQQARTKW